MSTGIIKQVKSVGRERNNGAAQENAELLADLRQALEETFAGNLLPAMEVLDELESEIEEHADRCDRPASVPATTSLSQEAVSARNQ